MAAARREPFDRSAHPTTIVLLCLCFFGDAGSAALAQQGYESGTAQEHTVPDTYTAVTRNMTPAGVTLRFVVTQWSSEDERAAAVAALNDADDPAAALAELPTMGVVWRDGSPVGDQIKYAERQKQADGGELVTVVTDKPLGPLSRSWTANDAPRNEPLKYSVVQMSVNEAGTGTGTMSFAADVVVDAQARTVSLDVDEAAPGLLTEVERVPKPYWAGDD